MKEIVNESINSEITRMKLRISILEIWYKYWWRIEMIILASNANKMIKTNAHSIWNRKKTNNMKKSINTSLTNDSNCISCLFWIVICKAMNRVYRTWWQDLFSDKKIYVMSMISIWWNGMWDICFFISMK